ncbi:unnamed protein product, partial [Nesidiocoris tenuis]
MELLVRPGATSRDARRLMFSRLCRRRCCSNKRPLHGTGPTEAESGHAPNRP